MVNAIYAFSGDPITYGHIDIIQRAASICDKLIVAIGEDQEKNYTFITEERKEMARKVISMPNVEVTSFSGLLANYAYAQNVSLIFRGLRDLKDMEAEMKLHETNKILNPNIETIILLAKPNLALISSTNVRNMQKLQADITGFVPLYVKECLERRISGQYIVGVTGEMGSGKSYVSNKLAGLGRAKGLDVHNIELDDIGHDIIETLTDPGYHAVREKIIETFGEEVRLPGDKINRKALGEKVFGDPSEMDKLNSIMYQPLITRLREEMYGKKGILLFNAALIVESDLSKISNNNVILVDVNKESQTRRLKERGLNEEQIGRRLASQYTLEQKESILADAIAKAGHGKIWKIDNSDNTPASNIESVFEEIVESSKLK